jgi:hypothetical protein
MSQRLQNASSARRIANLLVLAGVATAIFWFAVRKPDKRPTSRDAFGEEPVVAPATSPTQTPLGANPSPTLISTAPALPTLNVPIDEAQLMVQLRRIKESNAELAIQLARDGNRRFPNSADAPERTSILIHALSSQNRPSEARGEAEDMVNRYPDSAWVHEIEAFTGAHRHRNARVNDAGELEYY